MGTMPEVTRGVGRWVSKKNSFAYYLSILLMTVVVHFEIFDTCGLILGSPFLLLGISSDLQVPWP